LINVGYQDEVIADVNERLYHSGFVQEMCRIGDVLLAGSSLL